MTFPADPESWLGLWLPPIHASGTPVARLWQGPLTPMPAFGVFSHSHPQDSKARNMCSSAVQQLHPARVAHRC
jgi:hypothetical protein